MTTQAHITAGHNDALFRIGCDLRRSGIDAAGILNTLQDQNARRCKPPLSDMQVRRIAENASRAHGRDTAEWRRQHAEYLLTPRWKHKCDLVKKRAGGLCEGCLEAPATEVHHLTYKHWRDELLFELVALCRDCHERAGRGRTP